MINKKLKKQFAEIQNELAAEINEDLTDQLHWDMISFYDEDPDKFFAWLNSD